MSKIRAHIKGAGGYVPPKILTNFDLEKLVDTSNRWILERTGIKERRLLEDGEGTSKICIKAFENLRSRFDFNVEDIDLVIVSTSTPDFRVSGLAPFVAKEIGAINAFAYDLGAACSGFLYGNSTATAFIESGRYKKILVFGADKMSSIINYKDRDTCVIFGDGGGVVLLENGDDERGFIDEVLYSNGSGNDYLKVENGGSLNPITKENIDSNKQYLFQEGKVVFKNAITEMINAISELMKRNNLTRDSIDWVLPHQANVRIIELVAEKLDIDRSKLLMNIEKYGNTTNGTIPLLFSDFQDKFKEGDNLVLVSFGAGFTWGAQYIKWSK